MSTKVIAGQSVTYRPYRFAPKANQAQVAELDDPEALQRALSDGFQEGSERGFEQGLLQGREAGHREGLERGLREGHAEGVIAGERDGRARFETAAAPFAAMVENYQASLAGLEQQRRHELLELVKKVAQQVIRCELTLHPTQLLSLVEEALATLPGADGAIEVRLNPEECARIRDIAPESASKWQLVADDQLALGELRVITGQAEADLGCQQRLDACVGKLADHLQLVAND